MLLDREGKLDHETVWVRRQWNDWRQACFRLDDVEGLDFSDTSGGVVARAPRKFLHGYVACDAMLEGDLAHSCRHGNGPHRIKVCIVKKDNSKEVYAKLEVLASS